MDSAQLRNDINTLSLSEKLHLVEDLWDSIAKDNDSIPMPNSHKEELDSRFSSYKKDESEVVNWSAVHEELRNKYKRE